MNALYRKKEGGGADHLPKKKHFPHTESHSVHFVSEVKSTLGGWTGLRSISLVQPGVKPELSISHTRHCATLCEQCNRHTAQVHAQLRVSHALEERAGTLHAEDSCTIPTTQYEMNYNFLKISMAIH